MYAEPYHEKQTQRVQEGREQSQFLFIITYRIKKYTNKSLERPKKKNGKGIKKTSAKIKEVGKKQQGSWENKNKYNT